MANETIIIYNEFKSWIDQMRYTSTITGIVDNTDNTYTITTVDVQGLAAKEYIVISDSGEINGNSQLVTEVNTSTNTFKISLTSGATISTLGTWKCKAPYSFVGYDKEVSVDDVARQNSHVGAMPLFWCAMGLPEKYRQEYGVEVETDFFIAIIDYANPKNNSEDALTDNIVPVLHPLFVRFLATLEKNISDFVINQTGDNDNNFPLDRHFHSKYNYKDKQKNQLAARTNAIVIDSLPIKFRIKAICNTN